MKVILLENLKRIGSIGEVIDVKRGFARNFLIANKKALYASKDNIKEVEKINQFKALPEPPKEKPQPTTMFEEDFDDDSDDIDKIKGEIMNVLSKLDQAEVE